jgi:hypothetical protein
MSIGNNNLSRIIFKDFLEENQYEQDGRRNVFIKNGKKIAFSITEDKIQCRQFYEDCSGLVCYDMSENKYYEFDRSDLELSDRPSRISPATGLKAYSAYPWR